MKVHFSAEKYDFAIYVYAMLLRSSLHNMTKSVHLTSGLSILIHGAISLLDASSYIMSGKQTP